MPKLQLVELRCRESEESSDEIYIAVITDFAVSRIYKTFHMRTGNILNLKNLIEPINFKFSTLVGVNDEDGPFDGDDYLGGFAASSIEAGKGLQTADIDVDNNARYKLSYEILP